MNNLLNALYYDYAVASAFTPGRFSAYPLPGRTFTSEGRRDVLTGKAGLDFARTGLS